jgi:uncharacterized membrane protein
MESILPGLDAATNVHPVFVHFPIALWSASCAFALAAALRGRDDLLRLARWLLYLGTASAFAAVATGWLAMGNMPGHGPMWVHKMWMLAATGLAVATSIAAYLLARKEPRPGTRWIVAAGLLATSIVTTIGADRGALLVYRYHIGTTRTPESPSGGGESGR